MNPDGGRRRLTLMSGFTDNGCCFVCGPGNPLGLKLRFLPGPEAGSVEAEVLFPDYLQGWENVVHGGLIATVLDEAMIKAAFQRKLACVTGEVTVRYLKPAATGAVFMARGRVLEERGRIVLAESELLDASGTAVARATGKLFKTGPKS